MKKIKVQNVRLGFATNSSSSHCILVFPSSQLDSIQDRGADMDDHFGWDCFTLKSKELKTKYLMATLENNLHNMSYGPQEIKETIGKLFNLPVEAVPDFQCVGVDHQSIMTFPVDKNGKLNEEFFKDLSDYIINTENVVILGGNDNDGSHELSGEGLEDETKQIPRESSSSNLVAKKVGDYWIMFNTETGAKMRFSFDLNAKPLTKLPVPELVDIKITDFCPYNCDFCYQGSTEKGSHADFNWLTQLAEALGKENVFEVALGGGEPTLHPNFIEILETFRKNHIVPNFTTKNITWIKNNPEILELCGGAALSVEGLNDIKKAFALLIENAPEPLIDEMTGYNRKRSLQFQYVMGTQPLKELDSMLAYLSSMQIQIPITLLGFKDNHRGMDFPQHDYKNWLDIVQKYDYYVKRGCLKIDTALAAQSIDELKRLKIPENSYHTTEGTFSLYVDATNKTMAPSSYMGLEQTVPMDLTTWVEEYENLGVDIVEEINNKKKSKVFKIHPQ